MIEFFIIFLSSLDSKVLFCFCLVLVAFLVISLLRLYKKIKLKTYIISIIIFLLLLLFPIIYFTHSYIDYKNDLLVYSTEGYFEATAASMSLNEFDLWLDHYNSNCDNLTSDLPKSVVILDHSIDENNKMICHLSLSNSFCNYCFQAEEINNTVVLYWKEPEK